MESDSEKATTSIYHCCITVYPLLIRRIFALVDKNRLLNQYIFSKDNAHHEKYMITNSGNIENGQFVIYFTNNISTETIYETMKSESLFSCTIPSKSFITEPNKDRFIPNIMRKWRWKKESNNDIINYNYNNDWKQYDFDNCYAIEHAIENKHDSVVLAIKEDSNISNNDDYISGWHLIIFNKEFAERNKNVGSIKKTNEIEIQSETFHTGMITKIDHELRKGFVFNKNWNSHHQFIINSELYHKIKVNQLIEYTLRIPRTSYLYNDDEPIKGKDCIADNVNIISGTLLLRPKSNRFSGLSDLKNETIKRNL